jgi:peptidoglycan-associated lipoprotein
MSGRIGRSRWTPALAALTVLGAGSACATVSPDDLETRLGDFRTEMTEQIDQGDQEVRSDLSGRMDDMEARVDALRADLRALEEEFEITVTELETALRFDVPVYFGFDEADVADRGREAIARFSQVVQTYYPEATITVEGFTDPAGPAAYNMRLGMRRAEAVKGHLVDQGLVEDRVRAVSYGEDTSRLIQPASTGPGTEGWQNRRVVLVIDHAGSLSPSATMTDAGTS